MLYLRWLYTPRPSLPFAESPQPSQLARPFPAAQQHFPDLAPFGFAATTGPLTFSPSPEQFPKDQLIKSFAAAEQQFVSPVLPPLVSIPSNAAGIESDIVFQTTVIAHNMQWPAQSIAASAFQPYVFGDNAIATKPVLSAAQQQFGGVVVPAAFVPRVFGENPINLARALPVFAQRFPDLAPFGYAATTGPLAFLPPPEQFAKQFNAALQRNEFVFVTPRQPYVFAEPPPQFAKPFAAALQRPAEYAVQSFVTATTPALVAQSPPELFARPFAIGSQLFSSFGAIPTLVSIFSNVGGIESDVVFATTVIAHNMQWPAQSVAAATTPSAFGYSESPPEFGKLFPALLQQFAGFQPIGTIVSTTPQGGYSDLWFKFAAPLSASQQQFNAFPIFRATTPPVFSASLERFANPFPVMLQRVPDYAMQTFVAGATPSNFGYSESPTRFAAPFPASAQQFGAFQPLGTITFKSKGGEWIIRARRRHKR